MINVMVNGLPGKMASAVVGQVSNETELNLVQFSLTGPILTKKYHGDIELWTPSERGDTIKRLIDVNGTDFISVDYTHPDAVNDNADFYCRHKLPFVMGTTGGDRTALEKRVKDSDISAVIAPNMAKQIVAFQAMMKYASETFPDAFQGYNLEITESHQNGKADTSGTAKAMLGYFNSLGIPFTKDQIVMIRNPTQQIEMGIPEEYLGGHGWHSYSLKSEDGNTLFQFTHNVNGREIYAKGTIDAIKFLNKKVNAGERGKVYSMIDVLSE